LNPKGRVALHKYGLANEDAEMPFYTIDNGNEGLGTFSNIEQYDQPLDIVDRLKAVRGDDYLQTLGIEDVDAIKIDVQGFEGEVLLGLRNTIRNNRPIVWIELGTATKLDLTSSNKVQEFFPYPIRIYHLAQSVQMMIRGFELIETTAHELPIGDYFICPRDQAQSS
jgi:FkbM family methyltransferase